jgi:histidyl-tRNA synthetase
MKSMIQSLKGTRDYYPEIMAVRSWLYATVRQVSESYGYQEYDGPFLEPIELYAAKSGDELVKEQSYVFEDRGGNLIALRPELTPSLARMIAQRQNQLVFPLRWWSFGPFWRYERPQKGRTREFFQWNIDMIGNGTPAADAELIAIIATFFRHVGLTPQDALIFVNNRRLMEIELKSLGILTNDLTSVFRLIDRKEKLSDEEWETYAGELGLTTVQIDGLKHLLADSNLWQKSEALQGLFPSIRALGVEEYVQFSPHIIRGLDYYTGTVFEAQAIQGKVRRSILGGGRYDNLLSDVGGDRVPATGFAMGDLVITLILEELNLIPEKIKHPAAQILVTTFDLAYLLESLSLTTELRQAGLGVACYSMGDKLAKQLKYADRIGVRLVVVLGPDELAKQAVTLKNLATRQQLTVPRSQAAGTIRRMLDQAEP